jgi:hypothetical protein
MDASTIGWLAGGIAWTVTAIIRTIERDKEGGRFAYIVAVIAFAVAALKP